VCVWSLVAEWFALWTLNQKVGSSSPSVGMMFSHHFPYNNGMVTSSPHQSTSCDGYLAFVGVANSPDHVSPCPHPSAERHGQASCEFLAQLQEVAYTGSLCLLSEQASWLC